MTDKPLPKDEPGAEERFDQAIKNALATPPKPQKTKEGKEPKVAPSQRSVAARIAPEV